MSTRLNNQHIVVLTRLKAENIKQIEESYLLDRALYPQGKIMTVIIENLVYYMDRRSRYFADKSLHLIKVKILSHSKTSN